MKTPFFRAVLLGAFLGTALMGWLSPFVISWYFAPPVDLAVNCREAVDWGISQYRYAILIGTVVGAIGGALLFRTILRRTSKDV
jgi:hypothetical protein